MSGTRIIFGLLSVFALPVMTSAQVHVTSMYGPVEIHFGDADAPEPRISWVDSRTASEEDELPTLEAGDRIVTGTEGQVTLQLEDGSYIVVAENTTLEIERYWGSELRNLMRVFMGKVRFHIQKLGGRPNPYRIHTPTALIAVRGTDFDVRVDPAAHSTEIWTFEGRVTVVGNDVPDREVILDAGRKTLVRSGQAPLTPVGVDSQFGASRVFEVVRTDDAGEAVLGALVGSGIPGPGIGIDNDRRNRTVDPLRSRGSIPSMSTQRLKLSYPER